MGATGADSERMKGEQGSGLAGGEEEATAGGRGEDSDDRREEEAATGGCGEDNDGRREEEADASTFGAVAATEADNSSKEARG
ncbi:hypothetical protein B296_00012876 [Ensete ventricosum]|uniref:Uncharacterized protein n=1 Tax=Ensete ventricosum TaxID=4639 RepID=A0A426Z8E3_ENSVE|nr:hypothetical protein B296_00012876 [Ensete ventricosum]